MHQEDRLLDAAFRFISAIKSDALGKEKTTFPKNSDGIKEAAAFCRQNIFRVNISPLPRKISAKIARPEEKAEDMVKRCLSGTWRSVGREVAFPHGLDYHSSPDPQFNSSGCPYGEWTWQLNRHSEWTIAAQLYHESGDEHFAQAIAHWLRTWLTQCPSPHEDLNNHQGPWRTIEIGIRLGSQWPQVLSALIDSPSIEDTLLLAWLQSIAEQAEFAYRYRKTRNWLLMEMNGLVHAGVLLPMHQDAERWKKQAMDVFLQEMDEQFHPDHLQVELSPSYHGVCFNNMFKSVQTMELAGYKVDSRLITALKNMLVPLRALVDATCNLFRFQDCDDVHIRSYLKTCPIDWLVNGDEFFLDSKNNTPPTLCHALEHSGYVILRSGYGLEHIAVAFDGGPYGASHQHEDKLSIQISHRGKVVIGEAGKVDYSDTPERRYSLTSAAHNTALVDGHGQNRGKSYLTDRDPWDKHSGMRYNFNTSQPWAQADYQEGYGPDQHRSVRHTRKVTLVDATHVEVFDEFESLDGDKHKIEVLFHAIQDRAALEGSTWTTFGKTSKVRLNWSEDSGKIHAFQTLGGQNPDLRGWAEAESLQTGILTLAPRPCLTLEMQCKNLIKLTTKIEISDVNN